MDSNDGVDEFSGSDADDGFDEDMEALRRACLLTGTNLGDLENPSAAAAGTSGSGGGLPTDSDVDDGEDDLELVRNIQKRFAIVTGIAEPLTLKPLCWIPPVEEEEDFKDDFETLRAIQRRFAAYSEDGLKESSDNVLQKPENDGVTDIATEEETSNFFAENSQAREEFSNYVDRINNAMQNPEASSKVNAGTQLSDFTEWHDSDSANAAILPVKGSSFPKAAEAFVDAIKKNRSCQKLIRSKLMHIEARMEELKKLNERVKILKDFQLSCRKKTVQALSEKKDARVQLISVPKLSANSKLNEKKLSPMQYGPAENLQVANYREALKKFPVFTGRNKWSEKEKENLANGVKQQFQKMLLERSVDLLSYGDGSFEDSGNLDSIVASIRDLDITPEKMRLFLPKVNWDQLASMYVPGRSGAECQARWLNCEDPLINQNPWTSMEDKNLLHVVQQKGLGNWIDIAVSLGTNRTPFQCLARYQRSLNASIIKREWTEEEDNQLRAAVEAFGESNWQVVASAMEGRTGTQCSNRWIKTLHPARQRVGKWTPDEDKRLKVAVMLFGAKTWKKIAQFVPGRTQVQCRERWVNSLDPSLNLNEWTEEEDSKLKAAIEEHGYCWSKVAACVPPRTDSQCRRRWKVLLPHQVPLLQAARKMQRAALISNFVDRESERPALRPCDFVPLPEITCISESEYINLSEKQGRRSRRRGEDAETISASGDLCSEEGPVNGTEGETFTNTSISRKKRQKRHLGRTKSNASMEQHLSYCPITVEPLAITNGAELEASGGVDGRQKRNDLKQKRGMSSKLKSKAMVSGHDSTSKKKARKPRPKKDGGSDKVECQLPSFSDMKPFMITDGEEVSELVGDDKSATWCKEVFNLHPGHNSCSEAQEKNRGCNDIANGEEVRELVGDDESGSWCKEVFNLHPSHRSCNEAQEEKRGGNDIANRGEVRELVGFDESATWCKEVFNLHPSHSSCNEAQEEKRGGNYIANGAEIGEVGRSNGVVTPYREASKVPPRQSGCNEPAEEIPVIYFSNLDDKDVGDDTIAYKQRSETKLISKKNKSADAVDHHLSSSLNLTTENNSGASKKRNRSRNTGGVLSNQTLAAAETCDDDMTLASFCNKFKKRKRVKLADK